jgi:Glycosyl transferase family 2
MRPLTLAFPYYENSGILKEHQRIWAQYPDAIRRKMTVIIADDGSPNSPAADAVQPCDYEIQIYRIGVNIPWNQTGARNLAMHCAPEGWVLVTDIDHVLMPDDAAELVGMKVKKGHYYIPARRIMPHSTPYKRHPNSYYLTRQMYWDAGGCDEDFAGHYGSDSTFRRALTLVGTRVELDSPALTLYGRDVIPDASTTEWGRKDSPWHSGNNPDLKMKKLQGAYKAKNPLRFEWTRVL